MTWKSVKMERVKRKVSAGDRTRLEYIRITWAQPMVPMGTSSHIQTSERDIYSWSNEI